MGFSKNGFYWVVREEGEEPEIAFINDQRMAVTMLDMDMRHTDTVFWIGERLEPPEVTR